MGRACAGVVAIVLLCAGSAQAAVEAPGVPYPVTPLTFPGDELAAVSCSAPSACTAVGTFDSQALVERWDGTSWTIQPTPAAASSTLAGVSCTSATACVAVGRRLGGGGGWLPLAEVWDGTSWTTQTVPAPPSLVDAALLRAVSCTSPSACVAVGEYQDGRVKTLPFAVHWDGTSWSLRSLPAPHDGFHSTSSDVSCSSAAACVAVGRYVTPAGRTAGFAAHWDGGAWTARPLPGLLPDNITSGVSCSAASACTAVGTTLTLVGPELPVFGFLVGLGVSQPTVQRWNGSTWVQQLALAPDIDAQLDAVSCPSATACSAVGSAYLGAGRITPLAMRGTASTWNTQGTPLPAGAKYGALNGVSCPPVGACVAVGSYIDAGRVQRTLAYTWSPGASWAIQPTPNPS